MKRAAFLLIPVLIVLVACQAQPRPDAAGAVTRPAGNEPVSLPDGRTYQVVGKGSQVRIVLFPDGPLARVGHPHVIGGNAIGGEVVMADEFSDSGLQLEIMVEGLEADRPKWRLEEGFDPDMPESAIERTRKNMLSAGQLDADNHPTILIESVDVTGPRWQPDIDVRITLAGVKRELTVPVALDLIDHRLTATGRFIIRQSDFGIKPFSAAGGNIRVADEILIRFRIEAMAVGNP